MKFYTKRGSITFTNSAQGAPKRDIEKALSCMKEYINDFYKEKRRKINITLTSYYRGEFPMFYYEADLSLKKCWPFGCAGHLYTEKMPEKDSD